MITMPMQAATPQCCSVKASVYISTESDDG